jgi:hypothetical protein
MIQLATHYTYIVMIAMDNITISLSYAIGVAKQSSYMCNFHDLIHEITKLAKKWWNNVNAINHLINY